MSLLMKGHFLFCLSVSPLTDISPRIPFKYENLAAAECSVKKCNLIQELYKSARNEVPYNVITMTYKTYYYIYSVKEATYERQRY